MVAVAAEVTRLMDNARIHLPGALDSMLKLELFNVVDEFCKKTKYWQEEIEYTTRAGTTEYEVLGFESGRIIELLNNVNDAGGIVQASMNDEGLIELQNDPPTGDEYTATVVYTVIDPVDSNDYPVMPAFLIQKYGQGILNGLIGAMMAHPAKPYSNQQLAVYHTRKFAGVVAQARAEVRHKNVYDGQRWRFPRWS